MKPKPKVKNPDLFHELLSSYIDQVKSRYPFPGADQKRLEALCKQNQEKD